jgi:large subunit ribosomal protein L44e
MKLPKIRKTYCRFCKKHTEHKVVESKKKTAFTAHPLSYGNKKLRAKWRGRIGMGNNGRYSKPPLTRSKMYGKKKSKNTDLRFECSVCKKMHNQRSGFRLKKIEWK